MGLTHKSTRLNAIDSKLEIIKKNENDIIVALAGNPNVGKSTIFNALTGMNQHTGNWPGKTVSNAQGYFCTDKNSYVLVDIPGTYSLMAHSTEEEIARNYLCFGNPDIVVVVCDATCLERNLNLVLQTCEITNNVILCINLIDQAKKKNIKINTKKIEHELCIPVVTTAASKKSSIKNLTDILDNFNKKSVTKPLMPRYSNEIESAIKIIETEIKKHELKGLNSRWLSLRLLDSDESLMNEIKSYLGADFIDNSEITYAIKKAKGHLEEYGINSDKLNDLIVSSLINTSDKIVKKSVIYNNNKYSVRDRKIDRLLTNKITGYPIMIMSLLFIFWLTISGANYPSALLSRTFSFMQNYLSEGLLYFNPPIWLHNLLILGIFKTVVWVVSVMLPPMAIFFPLFTILEDLGFLPRIAFNLDKPFKCCNACGKQALTMCMGFGCNAAGVVGCRIIDSPRERLLAILTNNFVPCNGRFPTIITLISILIIGISSGVYSSVLSAIILTLVLILGILVTFLTTKLLSSTLLKGVPSSYTLELPPYRKPQITKVITRSIFDRALFVLGRAVSVAAPAGLIIWLMANVKLYDTSILSYCSNFLDPFAKLLGLDGVILIAFILGFPANEIVIPIIIMAYLSQGSLTDFVSISELSNLFISNGWSWITVICTIIFSLFHWPCSTTLLTIKKETGSIKWTMIAAILPTIIGMIFCFMFNCIAKIFI